MLIGYQQQKENIFIYISQYNFENIVSHSLKILDRWLFYFVIISTTYDFSMINKILGFFSEFDKLHRQKLSQLGTDVLTGERVLIISNLKLLHSMNKKFFVCQNFSKAKKIYYSVVNFLAAFLFVVSDGHSKKIFLP